MTGAPVAGDPHTGYLSLAPQVSLRRLEQPFLYDRAHDELYELNDDAMRFLERVDGATPGLDDEADPEFLSYLLNEGLAVVTPRPAPRAPRRGGQPPPSLRYLELYLTERCNLACGHCFLGDRTGRAPRAAAGHPRDLSLAAALQVLEEFDAMGGLRLLLTGGEALMHPRFWELHERLPEFGFRSVLFSNGWLLAEAAPRLRVHEVQVSLDGLEWAHDALRGQGSFARAVAGLEAAASAGLDVSVATMVHTGDRDDFPGMAELVRRLGVRAWHVDVPSECGALTGHRELLSPAQAAPFLGYSFGGGTHGAPAGAVCGSHLMAVLADGTGAKCGFYADQPVGDLALGLPELWRRAPRGRTADLDCACDYVDECHGGCRYRASTYNGEERPDPVQCARYGVPLPTAIP